MRLVTYDRGGHRRLGAILEGEVRDGMFLSRGGLRLPIEAPAGRWLAVIRPDLVRLVAAGGGTRSGFSGRVESSSYYGAMTRLRIAIGDEHVLMEAHFPSGARPMPGDAVDIDIDWARLRLVPEAPSSRG